MENAQIADIFEEIADLLELQEENQFRVRSYRNAAQAIRNQSGRLEDMVEQGGDVSKIPNIGKSIADKVHEILEKGTCKRLEDLRKQVPEGLTNLMDVPELGPRKAMQLYKELNVESLDQLKKACEQHKVRDLEGMGQKTEEKILHGIGTLQSTAGRILYHEACDYLQSLGRHLNRISGIKQWEAAGSFRRRKETVGDLDILVQADNREEVRDAILDNNAIDEVIGSGTEKISVRLSGGLQVDFRFFDPSSFGSALMYFTGSKAHNIKLRRRVQDKKWKLNEYGLFKGNSLLAGKAEELVYKKLDMEWIPPELREDRGEIEAALQNSLPRLVEPDDIRGDMQSHTTASDGNFSISDMARAARDYGLDYLAITDHSQRVAMANGLDDERARKHADAIRQVDGDMKRFWLLAGIEVDILKDGRLDLSEKTLAAMDWVVASTHYDRNMSRKDMTERIVSALKTGLVHCLAHPFGRIIGKRDAIDFDVDKVVETCIENNVYIEINAQPDRLDLPDKYCKSVKDAGARFVISTDAHTGENFHFMPFGVNVARRGWLTKDDILNTRTITQLKKELKSRGRK
jgi:DNA polymerase (family 10)